MTMLPLWREAGVGLDLAGLLRTQVPLDDGTGRPVLLVPGFLAGDGSLALMARWLRGAGHPVAGSGIRANVDCASAAVERLEARLEDHVEREGARATVVGHSRGGNLGRALAVRRPDLVERLVTLGTPHVDELAIHPLIRAQVTVVGTLGELGLPGVFSRDCLSGACCADLRERMAGGFPDDVRFVSIYSETDGVVDWRSCLHPAAEHVRVRATHLGMAANAATWRAVAEALAAPVAVVAMPLAA